VGVKLAEVDEHHIERMVYRAFRAAWEEDRGSRVTPPDLVYVTDVTQCLLKSWYQRTFGEPPLEEKVVLLVLGDDVHYILNESFPIGEGEKSAEKEYGGVRVRGRADRLLSSFVVEFKTVNFIPKEPYDHHVAQTQLYLWLFDKPSAFIVYVSKKDGRVKAFRVNRNEEEIRKLLERAALLSKHLREGTRPAPEPGWLCKYCEYGKLCGVGPSESKKASPQPSSEP